MFTIELPYPPTVNSYWGATVRNGKVIHYLSKRAKAFRRDTMQACLVARAPFGMPGCLEVWVELFPPDDRPRDVDNPLKALLDALQHAGIFYDDNQVRTLHASMKHPVRGGRCAVTIERMSAENTRHAQVALL